MEQQLTFLAAPRTSTKQTRSPSKKTNWEIFIDGAARGNPGEAGAGVYIKYQEKDLIKKGFSLNEKTNNQAEYLSLAIALFLFKQQLDKKDGEIACLSIVSDSELLVKQMKGEYKVKNPILQQIKLLIDDMLKKITYKIRHVLRSENKIADKLANSGINNKTKLPESFIKLLKKNKIAI